MTCGKNKTQQKKTYFSNSPQTKPKTPSSSNPSTFLTTIKLQQHHRTPPLPTLIFCFSICIIISQTVADSPVGYGYTVTTVTNNPAANSLTANLKLIKPSSMFGTDIPFLKLTASFETKDGLRVRITNSLHKRWEIPRDLIPRDSSSLFSSSSLSHSFLFRNPQNPKHILKHPNSDLIFTLHKPIPLINLPPFNYNPSSSPSPSVKEKTHITITITPTCIIFNTTVNCWHRFINPHPSKPQQKRTREEPIETKIVKKI